MNMLVIQKKSKDLEAFITKARRKLLEFEILQSKWEIAQGKVKKYTSVTKLMKDIKSGK